MIVIDSKELLSSKKILEEMGKGIQSGKVVVYPTDTVYGIGCHYLDSESLKRIYRIKERVETSPLIALLSGKDQLDKIAKIGEKERRDVEKLMEKFWPGGLTIILEKKESVPKEMVSGGNTIGVRVPNLEISRKIIEESGGVLATTSANISGERSPKLYKEISEKLKERSDIIVRYEGAGKEVEGMESTIIDMRTIPRILRDGCIKKEEIEEVIGKVQ